MEPTENDKTTKRDAWRNWKTFTIKIKHEDLPVLNQRLKLYGYDTMTELTKDFIASKFPIFSEDRQIQAIDSNIQSSGLQTATVARQHFEPSFYRETDLDDLLRYLLDIRKLQKHNARSLVSYFRRYRDSFFGPNPVQLNRLTPHKRMWVMQSLRQFGGYYFFKTNNPECKELVEKIISRFGLNVGWDRQKKLYIVDGGFVEQKIKQLLAVEGDIGLTVKVGLYTGLREDEIVYAHNMEVCNNLGGCACSNLHVVNKPNGLTIVLLNWFRSHKKSYFTILPTKIWTAFREVASFNDSDIKIAHSVIKRAAGIRYMELRKIHYSIMCRVMAMHEADVLAGRAKSVAARHYLLFELEKMAEAYTKGWRNLGTL